MKLIFTFFLIFAIAFGNSQTNSTDTLSIVVTATRQPQQASKVAVPYMVINKKSIQLSGALKLNDILSEQTGLVTVPNFGAGLQMQGLSADYTMILLNGEPLIGRNGGTLDLSRVVVGNIERIEIVKGPFSSLYGSEALGGVINIITTLVAKNSLSAQLRYGSNSTTNSNIDWHKKTKKISQQFFADHNSTAGYSFNANQVGQTADPFNAITTRYNLLYNVSKKTTANIGLNYFYEIQKNAFDAGGTVGAVNGNRIRTDLTLQPTITTLLTKATTLIWRGYYARWNANQNLLKTANAQPYYNDAFQQEFARLENQTNIKLNTKQLLTLGGGIAAEILNTNRYAETKRNTNGFLFVQYVYDINKKVNIVSGFRYDYNKAFKASLNPKFAIKYTPNKKLNFNGSIGTAFKAPDFRQLYLNFTNSVAGGGYTVYGANETSLSQLTALQNLGLINSILPQANNLSLLKPESSLGVNIGAAIVPAKKLNLTLNAFYNALNNLIVFEPIAVQPNNAFVYSYFNKTKAFTKGVELNINYNLHKYLAIQAGYQHLITGENEIKNAIKNQTIYTRNADGAPARLLKPNEYMGLFNRSKHHANIKLFVPENITGWAGSFRAIYRSAWGVLDRDGNGIANNNRADEYAKGYINLHTTIQKKVSNIMQLQVGCDNILNYKDPINLPNIPGRTYYISIQINKQK